MRNSIIVAHRNRNTHLRHLLWSVQRSARVCGLDDYEVLIVDNGSKKVPRELDANTFVIEDTSDMPVLNKAKLLNLGISAATGDIITFLDADMIVGPRWLESALTLTEQTPTRLCYRCRLLTDVESLDIMQATEPEGVIDDLFSRYDTFRCGYEGQGWDPIVNHLGHGPMFGNSQFSIRRDVLGELRHDEEFIGRGFEDLWFIRHIWRKYGDAYVGELVDDAEHGLLHLFHKYGPDWDTKTSMEEGITRYKET